jgi:hypothetical protein
MESYKPELQPMDCYEKLFKQLPHTKNMYSNGRQVTSSPALYSLFRSKISSSSASIDSEGRLALTSK